MRTSIMWGISIAVLLSVTTVALIEHDEAQTMQKQMAKLQHDKDEKEKQEAMSAALLMATKQTLLDEYDKCVLMADYYYEIEWSGQCDTMPWEKRSDGICHTLPVTLAREISNNEKDRKDRCELSYRNKMQALGVRQ